MSAICVTNYDKKSQTVLANQYIHLNSEIAHSLLSTQNIQVANNVKKQFKHINADLDKYYTKPSIAAKCVEIFEDVLSSLNMNPANCLYIEPSAGAGSFLDALNYKKIGFDIAPTKKSIIRLDYLSDNLEKYISKYSNNAALMPVVIGNPPFGIKSKLAIDFVNKSFEYSKIVGFIVPIQFRKWSVQSKINPAAKLIKDIDIPLNSFEFLGKEYGVRCCFQIWVVGIDISSDLRIQKKPSTAHNDFEMYQYNRTPESMKFFDYDWDFAIPRQGYYNYSEPIFDKDQCSPTLQWIFFKASNDEVLHRLLNLNFENLSRKNLSIPGFGKADVVAEYDRCYQALEALNGAN